MQISKWVALGAAAFCLVAVGGVVNMPHLYYMAAMLMTLPAVSYLLGWYTLRGLEFTRYSSTPIWEGEETDIVYTARNRSRLARYFVSIPEQPVKNAVSIEIDPPLFSVKAGSSIEVHHKVRFSRRGVYQAGSFDVAALDPLGVFTFSRSIQTSGETVVYPVPRQMAPLNLQGADRHGWTDVQQFARHGDGVDTSGVRNYMPGDPLRRIHWRQTARTGKLMVIEYEETQSANLRIVLDTSIGGIAGDEPDTSLEYAIRAAATVARDAIQNGASVDLVVADNDGAHTAGAWSGLLGERADGRMYALMDALARVEPQSGIGIGAVLESTVATVPRGTTLLAICIDPDPLLPGVVARAISSGVAVSIVYIDRSTFPHTQVKHLIQGTEKAIAETAALGVPVFVFSWNEAGALQPVELN
jgi:uncharacterized protein (DUF58 family)